MQEPDVVDELRETMSFWTQRCRCTYGLPGLVTAWEGPAQVQPRQSPGVELKQEKWAQSSSLSLGAISIGLLLAEGSSVFLSGVAPGISIAIQIRPHSQEFGPTQIRLGGIKGKE